MTQDKFAGCLLGLAIGDALGMPFEGMRADTIRTHHGEVREFLPAHGLSPGQYTDDTKMMLCIAESIVEKGRVDPEDVAQRFVGWFDSGDLRGIGLTCQEAILNLKGEIPWRDSGRRGYWAAGNGAAMRIAPVGLIDCHDMEQLREDSWATSVITHNNSEAVAGAVAVAYPIAHLISGEVDERTFLPEIAAFVGDSEVARHLEQAQSLFSSRTPTEDALAVLGTSGYVVETVASAFYCFLRTPDDFLTTVSSAVMGGGDADTTAAVAGAISGAYNGVSRMPKHLVEGVEDSQRLQQLGKDICRLTDSKNGG
jgi:ADP-ribosyl-[dinitrogen reductase] hydrolase